MESYKQEFIEFTVASDVLKFGEFTLKSGRKSPFFMNAGAYPQEHSFASWVSIMRRPFTIITDWILIFFLDRHTREFL